MNSSIDNTLDEPIELRLTFKPDDELYPIFRDLKKECGLKNNSEVIRFILKQISKIPFSELMENIQEI